MFYFQEKETYLLRSRNGSFLALQLVLWPELDAVERQRGREDRRLVLQVISVKKEVKLEEKKGLGEVLLNQIHALTERES